eukprot:CAMPEP_0183345794 /NCGR_PEP_ID=MMETSP0164_2-20130417/11119_1 /TAXON_ID=221442 /ORGANISM="Coccolithus pelagicus ssp braarudi, Strain PLY182g" /LENGTH=63 /DNA_ID=CAMNT_0025516985 /DNA_START=132 /DNA_END=323 /DNA_ORIENTATION=-
MFLDVACTPLRRFKTTAFGARLHSPKHPDCSTVQGAPTAPASSSISSSTDSAPCLRHEPAWQT